MARPSHYSDELAAEICRRIADGESLRKVCRDEAMPDKSTVLRWLALKANLEFRDQYARAREMWADSLFDETLEIADDATNDITVLPATGDKPQIEIVNHENIQRSRLRVDTRKWAAGRLAPKKYGDKVELTGAGPGGAIQVQAVTAAQVQDDLSHIFGQAAVGSIAEPEPVQPAEPAAGPDSLDPVVPEGADGGGGEVAGAPAASEEVALPERPILLIDDDMPAEGP